MSWPTWTNTTYDFTTMSNTSSSVAGSVGTSSVGIPGWRAKATGWQISSNKAINGTSSELSNLVYLDTHPGQSQRLAVQCDSLTGTGYVAVGVGYNSTTGDYLRARWNLQSAAPSINWKWFHSSSGSAPATLQYNSPLPSSATYASPNAADWLVITRIVQKDRNEITAAVYPDTGSNTPDYAATPKVTDTNYYTSETFESFGFNSYVCLAPSGQGGTDHNYRRVIVGDTDQFITNATYLRTNVSAVITLTGLNTAWNGSTIFTVSANRGTATLTFQNVTSATAATLTITTPAVSSVVTISDGSAQNIVVVTPYGQANTSQVYTLSRGGNAYPVSNDLVAGTAFKPNNSIFYGIGANYTGTKLYLVENTPAPGYVSKSGIDGSNITLLDHTMNNPRKTMGLPDGTMLVANYGGGDIQLFDQNDVHVGTWSQSPADSNGALGMCLFPDPTRNGELTVLSANFSATNPGVNQYDGNGNFIKLWASGSPLSRAADVIYDGASAVYICSWGGGSGGHEGALHEYDTAGNLVGTHTVGSDFFGMEGLTNGKIICASEGTSVIHQWYPGRYYLGENTGANLVLGGSLIDVTSLGPPPSAIGLSLSSASTSMVIGDSLQLVIATIPALSYITSVSIVLTDGAGGTFSPSAPTLTTTLLATTVTYTPASTGHKTISMTNGGGLTNPSPLSIRVTDEPAIAFSNIDLSRTKVS